MSQQASTAGPVPPTATIPSIYDTYLCKDPANDVPILNRNGPDEYTAKMRTLQRSADYFAERDQVRTVERLQLQMARVHMEQRQWERAARVLTPLWQTLSWRRSGWWHLLEEVDWALRDCATRVRDLETLIAVDWELLNKSLTPRQDWKYDFGQTLDPLRPIDPRPRSVIRAESILSCVSTTFGFSSSTRNVGEHLTSQIVVSSCAQDSSTPLVISQIKIAFEGNLKNLIIQNDASEEPQAKSDNLVQIIQVPLPKSPPDAPSSAGPGISRTSQFTKDLVGSADLTLGPGATKALNLTHVPRDPGDVEIESITLCVQAPDFDLELIVTEDDQLHRDSFFITGFSGTTQNRFGRGGSNVVQILPKPPKLRIEMDELASILFTNESSTIKLRLINDEEDDADVAVNVRVLGPPGLSPGIAWIPDQIDGRMNENPTLSKPQNGHEDCSLSESIGRIASSSDWSQAIRIQAMSEAAEYVLETNVQYHLLSDPETPLTKSFSMQFSVVLPFEVSYSFTPMIRPEPWPSYFDVDVLDADTEAGGEQSAKGLSQWWSLISRIYSLANVPLTIKSVAPNIIEIHEATTCVISPVIGDESTLSSIAPGDLQERAFTLKASKSDLEDRQTTFLDLRLAVEWCRDGSQSPSTVCHLAVPELPIPFGEPRVLAAARDAGSSAGLIHLEYTVENPSMYTLTFSLTMETSEEFSFSGVKNVSVQLVPLSKHTVDYRIMPLGKGVWISPQFKVFDTHFRKTLKVHATEGMRADKKGASIWVDADG